MIFGSKNKGDWSEFYVLIYLLGKGRLYAADESLNKISSMFFPLKKVFRTEADSNRITFAFSDINSVEIYVNENLEKKMPSVDFVREARLLLEDIKNGDGSFDIPHAEQFLNSLNCYRLAAPSNDITDISMEVHDTQTGLDQKMGFSIKSYIGGAPTLLNASGATNFVYEVLGLNDSCIEEINSINSRNKIQDRIEAIKSYGGVLHYAYPANGVFADNLLMIDSNMDKILAEALLYSYESNETDCRKIIQYIERSNPLNYPRTGIYIHKYKEFLCAKALGLNPSREWDGIDDANGGYIVAKSDGEVLAYHLYNRDKFKQYLFETTKFERGSTSRHDYAYLYQEDGKIFIKLNMQIRFKPEEANYRTLETNYYGQNVAEKTAADEVFDVYIND